MFADSELSDNRIVIMSINPKNNFAGFTTRVEYFTNGKFYMSSNRYDIKRFDQFKSDVNEVGGTFKYDNSMTIIEFESKESLSAISNKLDYLHY